MFLLTAVYSCRDDDKGTNNPPPNYPEQQFAQQFLSDIGYTAKTSQLNGPYNFVFGYQFTPLVNGKIKAVKLKLPVARPAITVSIWDTATQTVLKSASVTVVAADTDYTVQIDPLQLTKDKQYMITFQSNVFYSYKKPDSGSGVYPVTAGNIRVDGFQYTLTGTYPDMAHTYQASGDLDFIFQQTN